MKIKELNHIISFGNRKKISLQTTGLPPGTLIYTGEARDVPLKLELIQYNADEFYEENFLGLTELKNSIKQNCVSWIHVNNLSNTQLIEEIGNHFNIHILTLEDI
ncbi:MAG: hypothetical protein HC906_01100 [Bacteroidales bacterium]|nr:hypothetical protein [Bacteroidales bacterium]